MSRRGARCCKSRRRWGGYIGGPRYGGEHLSPPPHQNIASSRSNTIRRLLLLPVRVIFLMSLLWPPMSTLITASIGYYTNNNSVTHLPVCMGVYGLSLFRSSFSFLFLIFLFFHLSTYSVVDKIACGRGGGSHGDVRWWWTRISSPARCPARLYVHRAAASRRRERWLLCVILWCVLGARRRRPRATACVIMSSLPGHHHHQRTRRVLNEIYQDKSRKHVRHRGPVTPVTTYRRLFLFFSSFSSVFIEEKRRDNINEFRRERERLNKRPSSSFLKLFTFCLAQRERFPTVDVATSIKSQLKKSTSEY